MRARLLLLTGALILLPVPTLRALEPQTIDRLLAEHWRAQGLTPASEADDLVLLRRVTLDLAGRVPTPREIEAFGADRSAGRYASAVRRLMEGPEFAWHLGSVLDEVVQRQYAGNSSFVGYLRKALRDNRRWDVLFREMMLGPWDTDERKPAALFLDRRARDIDQLTADVARSFFGVDVTCARCHNHPLVKDWKREHYYGLAAFLVRTTGGKGTVAEKADGEARYADKDGKERVAAMMFLSGLTVQEPAEKPKGTKFSRREQLVRMALEDKGFLSRAFVNRMWDYFLGRGLVDPVDQIHSGNPASVPALLDRLADDFVKSGYDIRRLVSAIVLSKAYRLDNRWSEDRPLPEAGHFAVTRLRPLSPRQLANSLLVSLGDGGFEPTAENLQAIEKQSAELLKALDPRTPGFQSSTREALYLSNSEALRKLVAPEGNNLTARLAAIRNDGDLIRTAFRATLGRSPTDSEADRVRRFLSQQGQTRGQACEDVVWALLTTAEFRFNH